MNTPLVQPERASRCASSTHASYPTSAAASTSAAGSIHFSNATTNDGKARVVEEAAQFVRRRALEEWNLLQRQWKMYVLCITINIYGGSMVFRNLAFYRYLPGERLTQDIGFQILPFYKGYVTGLPIFILQVTCILACLASFFPHHKKRVYAVNIIRRWGMMEAMGSVLRFFTYISTSIPGAADHCVPSRNAYIARDQPKTVYEILTVIQVDGIGVEANSGESGTYNCGDLVFSGHMLMTIAYAFTALRYCPMAFCISNHCVKVFTYAVWILVFLQGLLIISARNHYTMDVIIAAYTSPLLWHWYMTSLEPHDMKPFVGGSAFIYKELVEVESAVQFVHAALPEAMCLSTPLVPQHPPLLAEASLCCPCSLCCNFKQLIDA